MKVSVILPTVVGREAIFDRVWAAYERTCPAGWEFDVIVPEDYPTVGEAWTAGMEEADADYAFLAIDDAEPHPGWADVAVQTVDAGFIPAPRCLFPDGTVESCGTMGWGVLVPDGAPDMMPVRNTGMIFMRREWWDTVGPMPSIHYASDDYWTWKASLHGIDVVYRSGMVFTHHHELAATDHIRDQAMAHINEAIRLMTALRIPGSRYAALADDPIPLSTSR